MTRPAAYGLLIAWSLLVHLPGLKSPLLDYHAFRQTQTASVTRNYYRHGMHFFRPETDMFGPTQWTGTEFPLYSYGVAILYRLFGPDDIWGRLFSVALTACSALFLYEFVRRRAAPEVALLSGLAMCSIPVHIYFTRTFQPESMSLWAFTGYLYFLDRYALEERWPDAVAALALGAIGPLLKLPFVYLVGGIWLLLGIEKRRWRHPAYLTLLPMILILTAGWYDYARKAPAQILPLSGDTQMANLAAIGQWKFWEAHFISRFPEICATYAGLILGLWGACALRRRAAGSTETRFWFGWWILTAAYTVLLGQYGWIHKYTDLPWAPVNAVFIATGIVALWQRVGNRIGGRALVLFLAAAIPAHAALRIHHWYRIERLWLYRARDVFRRESRPEDLVLTQTDEGPVLLYEIDRAGYPGNFQTASLEQNAVWLSSGAHFLLTPLEKGWWDRARWNQFLAGRAKLICDDPEFLIFKFGPPVNAIVTKN